MVYGGKTLVQSMAMEPERSKPLHNFTLPFLKWGNQKYLRCMKLDSDADGDGGGCDRRSPSVTVKFNSCSSSDTMRSFKDPMKRVRNSKSKIETTSNVNNYEGIEAVREKLMIDLKTAAHKMKVAFLKNEVQEQEEEELPLPEPEPEPEEELRPWSLRTRRTASRFPNRNSPLRYDGGGGGGGVRSPEKKERAKFSVSLSKREIEEDFMAMMGRRPNRRPKKRPRIVQKQMDTLFPGLWLTEITPDIYEVPEIPENGKR